MTPDDQAQALVRRYLLGDLTDESENLEKRLMTDDASLEELEAAESELVDEYLAGRLSSDERSRFEQHFLSTPERQQKLKFARAFHRYAVSNRPSGQTVRVPANWFSLQNWSSRVVVVAVILMVVIGVWLFNRSQPRQPSVATITLTLTSTNRADGSVVPEITLRGDETALRIVLELPKVPSRYRAEVESENGEAIPAVVSAEAPTSLTIDVAATRLKPGQYVVQLFAAKTLGVYERVPGGYFFSVK